ncbi:MAG: hypothetical protein SNJ79_08785 [Sphingomonadaceae bacterium]
MEKDGQPLLLWGAALLSLAWIGFALWAEGGLRPLVPSEAVDLAARILVVPAALFALAAALRRGKVVTRHDLLHVAAEDSEAAAAAAERMADRLAAIRETLALDIEAVEATAGRLEARAAAATAALREAREAADGTASLAGQFETRLGKGAAHADTLKTQLAAMEAEGDRLVARLEAASAATAKEQAALAEAAAAVEAEAARARTALEGLSGRLRAEAAETLGMVDRAAQELGSALAAERSGLDAAMAEARATLSAIGSEAARALGRHLDGLIARARELEERIAAQAAATEQLTAAGERGFQLLDKRIDHAGAQTGATLGQLQERLEAITAAIASLGEPVRESRAAVGELDSAVGDVRESAASLLDLLAASLPNKAVAATAAAETMRSETVALLAAIEDAHARAAGLAEPVRSVQALLDAAASRFESQREAVAAAGQALVVELEQARQLIAEVEKSTEASSLAAATRLVDALTRVREVSNQATGTMRAMLEGLVAEARESLGAAAAEALRQGFVTPIAEGAAEAETRARAAAERSAASLAALAESLRLVDAKAEARVQELADLGVRDLVSASALLTDRLAGEAVSIASALGRPMDDEDWKRWRQGERGLFKRRALSLLERQEAREVRALLERDPDFAEAARRYSAGFEALLERLEAGPGRGLAALLRDSDSGRLAAALTEVLEG